MTEELKTCLSCGGKASICKDIDADGCVWHFVQCHKCGIRTRGKWVSSTSSECPMHYEDVRNEWNNQPEADALRAKLAKATEALRFYSERDNYRITIERWREVHGTDPTISTSGGLDGSFTAPHGYAIPDIHRDKYGDHARAALQEIEQ